MSEQETQGLIGDTPAFRRLLNAARLVATTDASLLLIGEGGTGKESLAREIHRLGPRRTGPFEVVQIAGLAEEDLEACLTGAFRAARGGSLFLDEVAELPAMGQARLLHRLDGQGGDVRVMAATCQDLWGLARAGGFRDDLYYRLCVVPLELPPLRERVQDIGPLLSHFLARAATTHGVTPPRFSLTAQRQLRRHAWPGNIRELSNIADRFSALYAGQNLDLFAIPEWLLPKGLAAIRSEMPAPPPPIDLPQKSQAAAFSGDDAMQALLDPPEAVTLRPVPAPMVHVAANDALDPALAILGAVGVDEGNPVEDVIRLAMGMDPLLPDGISLRDKLIDIERSYIEQALQRTDWNVSQTARILSLQRTTLIEKINKYGFKRA
jgi:sigma-54 specific flagellar transcriptional regulator A